MKRLLLGIGLLLAACDTGKAAGDVIGGVGTVGLVAVGATATVVEGVINADQDDCSEIATPEAFANTDCERACDDAKSIDDSDGIKNNCPPFAR